MLPNILLTEYADEFFGFGDWRAKIWFIGLEEGGGWSEQDIRSRLNAWQAAGRHSLEDAPRFYPASGCMHWHGDKAGPQATWKQLIRMLFLGRDQPDSGVAILNYQREIFGAFGGETCITELFPLPSPNIREWRYSNWSTLEWLKCRQSYEAKYALHRACFLRRQIDEFKPNVVIFYGTTQLRFWSQISQGIFQQAIDKKLMVFKSDPTTFFVTRHPARETDSYFREIGEFLRMNYGHLF